MGIKKQLSMGILSAMMGLSLLGVGTYAYFNDSEIANNTFAAGTLDLSVEPTEIINVDNIKPGDQMLRVFELGNSGTLDIEKVLLETDYTVNDVKGDNTEDFGEHIEVEFLYNIDKLDEVIYKTTLAELKEMSPEAVDEHILDPQLGKGLSVGSTDDFAVKFVFIDNGEDQNEFQGDSLELKWTFKAEQTLGIQK